MGYVHRATPANAKHRCVPPSYYDNHVGTIWCCDECNQLYHLATAYRWVRISRVSAALKLRKLRRRKADQ